MKANLVIEIHITQSRCGQCQHLDYYGSPLIPFICRAKWKVLPNYVTKIFATECPDFEENWAACQRMTRLGDTQP